jgi:guanine deaminase
MATEGGARLLGRDGAVGRVAPGHLADLVLLDLDHVNWLPLNDALNQLINTEDGLSVRDVFVGGRQVVRDGRLTTVDEARLARAAEVAAERLRRATTESRWLCDALAPHVACFCRGMAAPRGLPRRLIADGGSSHVA